MFKDCGQNARCELCFRHNLGIRSNQVPEANKADFLVLGTCSMGSSRKHISSQQGCFLGSFRAQETLSFSRHTRSFQVGRWDLALDWIAALVFEFDLILLPRDSLDLLSSSVFFSFNHVWLWLRLFWLSKAVMVLCNGWPAFLRLLQFSL